MADQEFSNEQKEDYQRIWAALDTSGDGVVSVQELTNELRASGLTNRAIDKIICRVDENRDGSVSFDEFLTTMASAGSSDSGGPEEEEIRGIFSMFDQNGDGEVRTAYQ